LSKQIKEHNNNYSNLRKK